jgi:hypothetical protein
MRQRLFLPVAIFCFGAALLPLQAQQAQAPASPPQQPPANPNRGVQVGVPDGRGGAPVAEPQRPRKPAGPAPRNTQGRAILGGATAMKKGVWLPGNGGFTSGTENLKEPIPYLPWAKAVVDDRAKNQLEPHTRCKPSGLIRQFLTPYGVEIVELPELQRVYIFDIGGPHTYRTIYMDGREHPGGLEPSYYGHSIGWWEGDTLVISTTGFNERFWLDRRGSPHTEKLRTLERMTRVDEDTIKYELHIDDPAAYSKPWMLAIDLRWEDGTELFEYQCQQANYADTLMVGIHSSADRSSAIVP